MTPGPGARGTEVVVVGAGLAGLACAQDLARAGVECVVLEASDGVGGRVRTDAVDGYLLDRGFQILLTAYPEVRRRLDLAALDLRTFEPGAVVRSGQCPSARGSSCVVTTGTRPRPRGPCSAAGALRSRY